MVRAGVPRKDFLQVQLQRRISHCCFLCSEKRIKKKRAGIKKKKGKICKVMCYCISEKGRSEKTML